MGKECKRERDLSLSLLFKGGCAACECRRKATKNVCETNPECFRQEGQRALWSVLKMLLCGRGRGRRGTKM